MFLDECEKIEEGRVRDYTYSVDNLSQSFCYNAPPNDDWVEIANATRSLMAELDANDLLDNDVISEWKYVYEDL